MGNQLALLFMHLETMYNIFKRQDHKKETMCKNYGINSRKQKENTKRTVNFFQFSSTRFTIFSHTSLYSFFNT